jgi:hypothetical protein
MRQRWRQTIGSALLYTLAFNLTFFIRELFLVVPKALTPGLRPTLYHNNHLWLGENPLAHLLQGTGALAIFISAIVCTLLLRGDRIHSTTVRLFLLWMAFSGFFQALPQVVIGAFVDNNHVGMALNYLRMTHGVSRTWLRFAIPNPSRSHTRSQQSSHCCWCFSWCCGQGSSFTDRDTTDRDYCGDVNPRHSAQILLPSGSRTYAA